MNRRNIVVASAILFLAGVSTASAQSVVPHMQWGVVAGANFANVSGSDAGDAKTRTGFVGGITGNYKMPSNFGVEIEGLYSQQGAKLNVEGDDVVLHLDYIQVPVLLRYDFPTHASVAPFILLGPSVGFRVKCELTQGSNSATCDEFGGQNAKSVDVSGVVGAGLGFKVGKEELSVQARYGMGFTKVFSDSDSKNKVFSVMAGFAF